MSDITYILELLIVNNFSEKSENLAKVKKNENEPINVLDEMNNQINWIKTRIPEYSVINQTGQNLFVENISGSLLNSCPFKSNQTINLFPGEWKFSIILENKSDIQPEQTQGFIVTDSKIAWKDKKLTIVPMN